MEHARQRLAVKSETASLDAQVLLAHILQQRRAWVMAHPEASLDSQQEQALSRSLERLEAGEPLPYVLGQWEFFGLEFAVTPATLIPRPETELLVEQALAWLAVQDRRCRAADAGVGSGCIAISLARHAPSLTVVGSDLSLAALRVAQENVRRHGVQEQVHLLQADLLTALQGPFDLICANLPYIPTPELEKLPVAAWEPRLALDGGIHGVGVIERLLAQSRDRLASRGLLLLEIEASSGAIVRDLAQQALPGACVDVLPDLAGRERLVRVQTN